MKSYFTIIENIAKGDNNSNYVLIAKKILECFIKGKFLQQRELANQCFLSISSITYFCKKLGVNGYRELIFLLKGELEKIEISKQSFPTVSGVSYLDPYYKGVKEIFEKNSYFIKNQINQVDKNKEINLVLSYNLSRLNDFLIPLFNEKNINITNVNLSWTFETISRKLNNYNSILFICTGRDNETLSRAYDLVKDKSKIFVITTEAQSFKFKDVENKMLIPAESAFFNSAFRHILIELIFLNIFHNVK